MYKFSVTILLSATTPAHTPALVGRCKATLQPRRWLYKSSAGDARSCTRCNTRPRLHLHPPRSSAVSRAGLPGCPQTRHLCTFHPLNGGFSCTPLHQSVTRRNERVFSCTLCARTGHLLCTTCALNARILRTIWQDSGCCPWRRQELRAPGWANRSSCRSTP